MDNQLSKRQDKRDSKKKNTKRPYSSKHVRITEAVIAKVSKSKEVIVRI